MKVVFASLNVGKVNEMRALLKNLDIDIIPQSQLNIQEIPETGLTFVENALLKARHASRITGLPAIADDSGLEVFALKGAPGIHSSRFAKVGATSAENITKLLAALKDTPLENRRAAFRCVLVYLSYAGDPAPIICQGTWLGSILTKPQGTGGFGYDPVFFDEEEQCSAAELSLDLKNARSHRGKALRLLVDELTLKLKG